MFQALPSPMRPPVKQLRKAAVRFIQAEPPVHAPAQLTELLARAGAHLIGRFAIPLEDAQDIALSAWSEISGRQSHAYVDLKLSTPHLLFLVDEAAGVRRPVPVVDLLRILGPREVAVNPGKPSDAA